MTVYDFDDVVVHRGVPDYVEQQKRTAAQKLQDELLDTASDTFGQALGLLAEGLECLTVLGYTSPNRNVVVLVGQLVEEVESLRRMRQ